MQRAAELSRSFGESNPKLAAVRSQIADVQSRLRQEIDRVANNFREQARTAATPRGPAQKHAREPAPGGRGRPARRDRAARPAARGRRRPRALRPAARALKGNQRGKRAAAARRPDHLPRRGAGAAVLPQSQADPAGLLRHQPDRGGAAGVRAGASGPRLLHPRSGRGRAGRHRVGRGALAAPLGAAAAGAGKTTFWRSRTPCTARACAAFTPA